MTLALRGIEEIVCGNGRKSQLGGSGCHSFARLLRLSPFAIVDRLHGSEQADVNRTTYMIYWFREQGFAGAITGSPERFGLPAINDPVLLQVHKSHIHMQRRFIK